MSDAADRKEHKVYLVGAGPGDVGLITLKGSKVLALADVVVYDYLVNDQLLKMAREDAELVCMGKRPGCHRHTQEDINAALVRFWKQGKTVVRLKGGDPFIFGRGGEEALTLGQEGIPFEVVPGITAGLGGLAYAGIPPTHRGLAVTATLVTGHEDPTKEFSALDLNALAACGGTLVAYMAVKNLPVIAEGLIRGGLPADTPTAMIYKATLPEQRTITSTLGRIADEAQAAGIRPPALLVVGRVVELRPKLNWFEALPLFGKRIVVTRPREQSEKQRRALEALGAEVIVQPAIAIEPLDDYGELDRSIANLESYDYLIFTSMNGVDSFLGRLFFLGFDSRKLSGLLLCAVGPGTARRLERYGVKADLVPDKSTGADLVPALVGREKIVAGKRALLPRADIAPDLILKRLEQSGIRADGVTAYRTVPREEGKEALCLALETGSIDGVVFASSSAAESFIRLLGRETLPSLRAKTAFISIGPATSRTLLELGFPPDIEAAEHTLPGLVEAVVRHLTG